MRGARFSKDLLHGAGLLVFDFSSIRMFIFRKFVPVVLVVCGVVLCWGVACWWRWALARFCGRLWCCGPRRADGDDRVNTPAGRDAPLVFGVLNVDLARNRVNSENFSNVEFGGFPSGRALLPGKGGARRNGRKQLKEVVVVLLLGRLVGRGGGFIVGLLWCWCCLLLRLLVVLAGVRW